MKISGGGNITSERGYGDMDKRKKMDCSAKGEVLLRPRDWLKTDFCERPSPSLKEQSRPNLKQEAAASL
jgi:hypothetical protein